MRSMAGDQKRKKKEKDINVRITVDPELTALFRGILALCTQTMFESLFPEPEEESEEDT